MRPHLSARSGIACLFLVAGSAVIRCKPFAISFGVFFRETQSRPGATRHAQTLRTVMLPTTPNIQGIKKTIDV